jgi:alpha,alpha-trehalase
MLRFLFVLLLAITGIANGQQPYPLTPDKIYGQLFIDVQTSRIFPDSKTFVDCIPLINPAEIVSKYKLEVEKEGFNLKSFVLQYFKLPAEPPFFTSGTKDIREHIKLLWKVLKRSADTMSDQSSLLPLPHSYIVPGGRFREIYYWDSYFTMLGLKASGEYEMMENMVKNFAHLIHQYGHIPNGNRTYYLSRSQPPFFSLMVELLASVKGNEVYKTFRTAIEKEYEYWSINRFKFYCHYWDELSVPRQESYIEDDSTANYAVTEFRKIVRFADSNRLNRAVDSIYASVCNNLRSAAASGWDFSSRWMTGEGLHTTNMKSIVPVDLYCLEVNLGKVYCRTGATKLAYDTIESKAILSKRLRKQHFNEILGWYCDYDTDGFSVMDNPTLAGMYPLFFKLADEKEVPSIVEFLKKNFLKDGGVVTSLKTTGQQWDAPNGWAPLQWITIIGLENYGYHELAKEIATRWVNLNKKVFAETGKLMEKYDVVDINKPAGGGEYPSQDGFGWTNGVLLALMNKYGL